MINKNNMKNCVHVFVLLNLLFFASFSVSHARSRAPVANVAWVPGTEKILVVNEQHQPLVWDMFNECPFYFFNKHESEVLKILVSDNGRMGVSSSLDKKIKIWDINTGSEIYEIIGLDTPASAIVLTSDSKRMVVGDWSGTVKELDFTSSQEVSRFVAFDDEAIASIDLFYAKRYIVAGSVTGEIMLWDMQLDKLVKRLKSRHKKSVQAIEFTNNGKLIVAASNDGRLSVWQHEKDIFKYIVLDDKDITIRSMDLSPDGQYAFVGTGGGKIYLVDLYAGEVVYQFALSDEAIQLIKFRSNFEAVIVDDSYNVWMFSMQSRTLRPVTEVSSGRISPTPMEALQGRDWFEKSLGMQFTWVPEGCFELGCKKQGSKGCSTDNMPARNICLDGYWMAKNEVKASEWLKVMKRPVPHNNVAIPLVNQGLNGKGNRFASGISWPEAQTFVCRLNGMTGANFRLPTEAEWEYACDNAAETNKVRGQHFSANLENNGTVSSGLNLEGMHSGVSEWVLDIYNRYGYSKNRHVNPLYTDDPLYYFYNQDVQRVKRGGAWDKGVSHPECIIREFNYENAGQDPKTGLRLTTH